MTVFFLFEHILLTCNMSKRQRKETFKAYIFEPFWTPIKQYEDPRNRCDNAIEKMSMTKRWVHPTHHSL